jgi:hypothetical protein
MKELKIFVRQMVENERMAEGIMSDAIKMDNKILKNRMKL